eukprot:12890750-Prorocentrum_lima.AAC.1
MAPRRARHPTPGTQSFANRCALQLTAKNSTAMRLITQQDGLLCSVKRGTIVHGRPFVQSDQCQQQPNICNVGPWMHK